MRGGGDHKRRKPPVLTKETFYGQNQAADTDSNESLGR